MGLDFLCYATPEQLGLDPRRSNASSPSGDKYLRKVLASQDIRDSDCIIDVGCGKGSAMRTMLRFPFRRVDGIEISEEIAAVARRNFRRLSINRERCSVYTADASEFVRFDDYNYVYFYNPFPCDVMSVVMDNVCRSLRKAPRQVTIIYNNPICDEIVRASRLFERKGEFPDMWGNGIVTYSSTTPVA
jgi:predicted RNA methylase